jgi:hypothetical protein
MPSLARILLATLIPATTLATRLSAQARPHVTVSRNALRVSFPVDTSRAFGWPAQGAALSAPGYRWDVLVHGLDEPTVIGFHVERDTTARAFRSLADLVRAGRASRCFGGMVVQCDDARLSATVRRDSIVVSLRDPTQIRRLFPLRERFVSFVVQWPEEPYVARHDSVRVHHVAPRLPLPTAAARVAWARARRRHDAGINSYQRTIGFEGKWFRWWNEAWLEVGDSMTVRVVEIHCTYDVCTETRPDPADSGWAISDTVVARLQRLDTSATARVYRGREARYVLRALRPGRTTLYVHGVHGVSDTAARSSPPERELKREFLVTARVVRVRIVSKADTVRVKTPFTFEVRAFDAAGNAIPDVPIQVEFVNGGINYGGIAVPGRPMQLDAPGLTPVVARVKQLADTAVIVAVDSASRKR